MKLVFSTVLCICILNSMLAQKKAADSLFLMNGRIVVAPVLDTTLFAATIIDPEDSTKRTHIDNESLFAIKYSNGDTYYYYKQDTIQNYFSRDEMALYMQGERDAKKGFKPWGAFYSTMACGLVGGLSGTLFGPALPAVFFLTVGIPKVRIKHNTVSNPNYLDYDSYILGYEREARSKRRRYSLVGGGIGVVAGYIAFFCLRSIYPASLK
jgi:hypothetical protein